MSLHRRFAMSLPVVDTPVSLLNMSTDVSIRISDMPHMFISFRSGLPVDTHVCAHVYAHVCSAFGTHANAFTYAHAYT